MENMYDFFVYFLLFLKHKYRILVTNQLKFTRNNCCNFFMALSMGRDRYTSERCVQKEGASGCFSGNAAKKAGCSRYASWSLARTG
jgi:hypothetical protein